MDWIKVRVKHIDYDYRHLSPETFKAWVDIMALCAGLEKIPTEQQIIDRVGAKLYNAVCHALRNAGVTLDYVLDKVYEDVKKCQHNREKAKNRQRIYRKQQCNEVGNAVCNGVTSQKVFQESKRERESKRESKKIPIEPLKRLVGVYGELKSISASDINNNYGRLSKAAKNLYMAAGEDIDAAEKALRDGAVFYNRKNLSWKLETISKNYTEIKAGEADPYAGVK